jgi:hypothetical protein
MTRCISSFRLVLRRVSAAVEHFAGLAILNGAPSAAALSLPVLH